MLSMGEDLKDKREKGYVEYKDHLQHKMLIIIFPCQAQCLSMREASLHFIASIEKDGNSPLTLSLFIGSFLMRVT
jgi:hypothetical protein